MSTRTDALLRLLLGGPFLIAGLLKIVDPSAFAYSIARLGVLPSAALGPVAIVLPWIEVVSALALLCLPAWRAAASRILGALLLLFTPILVVGMARGLSSCGCFGVEGGILGRLDVGVARNVLLMTVAGALWARERKATACGPRPPDSTPAAAAPR